MFSTLDDGHMKRIIGYTRKWHVPLLRKKKDFEATLAVSQTFLLCHLDVYLIHLNLALLLRDAKTVFESTMLGQPCYGASH